MGKFKSWKHHNLFIDIASSTCLVAASAGIVFGVSAGTFKINYIDGLNSDIRAVAANSNYNYYSQDIASEWDMDDMWNPRNQSMKNAKLSDELLAKYPQFAGQSWWDALHNKSEPFVPDEDSALMELDKEFGAEGISSKAKQYRYNASAMIIDGAAHTTLDRGFNQSVYNGIVNFVQNESIENDKIDPETQSDPVSYKCAKSFKPSADNTTEFINIYNSVVKNADVVALCGFNHITPYLATGVYGNGKSGDEFDGGEATQRRFQFSNKDFDNTAFLLIDGEVKNNQNIGSALFRSDQCAFISAISSCMYFLNNLDKYHDNFQDLSVGIIGGTAIATVCTYMGGFERGVEFFNHFTLYEGLLNYKLRNLLINKAEMPEIEVKDLYNLINHSKYKTEIETLIAKESVTSEEFEDIASKLYDEYSVKVIKLGEQSANFSGSFAAGDAIGLTKQFLNRGASAIITVGGSQTLDTCQEIQNQNSKCIVVGVDSPMEDGDFQRKFNFACEDNATDDENQKSKYKDSILKFSAVKDMKTVTQKFIQLVAENKNFDVGDSATGIPDREVAVCGPGYKTCGNILNGLVSVSWDGWYPLIQALRHVPSIYWRQQKVQSSFCVAWNQAAIEYCRDESRKLSNDFKRLVAIKVDDLPVEEQEKRCFELVSGLMKFSKTDGNGKILHDNYAHLLSILGQVFRNGSLVFPKELTVVFDKTTNKWIPAEEAETLSVLGWLNSNMYLM